MAWWHLAGFACGLAVGSAAGPALFAPLLARFRPDAVRVREIVVTGEHRLAPAEIAEATGVEAGSRLDHVDRDAVARRLETHPWIAAARVAGRLPPGHLLVAVEERVPEALAELSSRDGTSVWWVDPTGLPFARAPEPPPQQVRLLGAADAKPGQPDSRLALGVAIARALRASGLPAAREVHVGGGEPAALPALRLAGSPALVVLGSGELDAKLERLARLRAARLPEVEAASVIDLRFGERMVLRSDPSPGGDGAAVSRGSARPRNRGTAG